MIAVCMIVLCSVLLIVNVGTVLAYNDSYAFMEYTTQVNPVTVDGRWTTADEWHDGPVMNVGPNPNMGKFVYKINSDMTSVYIMEFDLEFADSTNDATDVFQICIDGAGSATATAPAATSYKIEFVGHTTLTVYKGTGTAWAPYTTTAVTAASTLATSPHDPASHYICEIVFDKQVLAGADGWAGQAPSATYGQGPYGIRIGMYDPVQGWVSWPPASSADNPSTWGEINEISIGAFPEGLTIGVMLLVSSVAAVVSIRYFRKPTKL